MSELFVFSNLVPSSLCYELHVNVPSISLEICICIYFLYLFIPPTLDGTYVFFKRKENI